MLDGWVKLHRSLMDDALWRSSTEAQKILLITVLMMANHEKKEWIWEDKKFICQRGQFITSLRNLAEKAQISKKAVEGALGKFEKYGFLGTRKGTGGTLITICNYDKYQSEENKGGQVRGHQGDTKGTPRGHNKNDKNYKNINTKRRTPTFSDDHMHFAEFMDSQIRTVTRSQKKQNLESWANTIRLMVDSDNRTLPEMRRVFMWANNDSFWRGNILSAKKFREKFDQLSARMRTGANYENNRKRSRREEVSAATLDFNVENF